MTQKRLSVISLIWSLVNLLVWICATIYVQHDKGLQHSIPYLAFVSNYALVSSSVSGVIAALAALFASD